MRQGNAVVIGGSVAGLVAARVLADHFQHVTLLERDRFPPDPQDVRVHLPQAHHQHLLLVRGRQLLEQLFPGFDADLAALGAPLVDYARDCVLCSPAGRLPRFASGLELRLGRRPLIDWVLRRHLALCPNLTVRPGCRATALLAAGGRVTGLVHEGPAQDGEAGPRPLEAELVVDAGGRASATAGWLQDLGCGAVVQEVVDPFLGYASRLYRPPRSARRDWRAVAVAARPPHNPRAAGLWEVEADRWLLTLIGTARHYPPVDEAGFLAFARALPDPIVAEAIQEAEPLTPIRAHRGLASRWRHYERLEAFPEGLVVLGDALCAFNPTHGQGMTLAALGAEELGRRLSLCQGRSLRGLGQGVHRALAERMAPVWRLATSDDRRWPGTAADAPGAAMRLLLAYQDLVLPLAPRSPALVAAFLAVANLVAPPSALVRPGLLMHLLGLRLRPRRCA